MIKKKGSNYQVVSETSKRNLGTYPSLKQAKARLKTVEYFKNHSVPHVKPKVKK